VTSPQIRLARGRRTQRNWLLRLAATLLALGFAGAAAAQPTAAAPASGVPAASYVQVVVGLVLVLGLVAAAAWLLRRVAALPGSGGGIIRVVGTTAVGQRERVVVVEVGGTWLLVGVAPGAVRALHTMPKAQPAPDERGAPAIEPPFAARLKQILAGHKRA